MPPIASTALSTTAPLFPASARAARRPRARGARPRRTSHGRGDLVERGGGLLEARGLLFGAPRQIVRRRRDFRRARLDASADRGDRAQGLLELFERGVEVAPQGFVFRREGRLEAEVEFAVGQPAQRFAERGHEEFERLALLLALLGFPAPRGDRIGLQPLAPLVDRDEIGGVVAEHLDRARDRADFVAALAAFDRDGEIARRDPGHGFDGGRQQPGDAARGQDDQREQDQHRRDEDRRQSEGHVPKRRIDVVDPESRADRPFPFGHADDIGVLGEASPSGTFGHQ